MEQLQHEGAGRKLGQRRDCRMTEGTVGVVRHAREVGVRNGTPTKGRTISQATSA